MNLICPICLSEFPITPETCNKEIHCQCGGHFSFKTLKWTYTKPRTKELPPVTKLKNFVSNRTDKE